MDRHVGAWEEEDWTEERDREEETEEIRFVDKGAQFCDNINQT